MKIAPKTKTKSIEIKENSVYKEYCEYVNNVICQIAIAKGKLKNDKYYKRWAFKTKDFALVYAETSSGSQEYIVYLKAEDDHYSVYLYESGLCKETLHIHIPGEWFEKLAKHDNIISKNFETIKNNRKAKKAIQKELEEIMSVTIEEKTNTTIFVWFDFHEIFPNDVQDALYEYNSFIYGKSNGAISLNLQHLKHGLVEITANPTVIAFDDNRTLLREATDAVVKMLKNFALQFDID